MDVTYIGHATALLDFGRTRVLTDPILRDRVMFLQRHGRNPSTDLINGSVPEVVLLSHLHYDHADLPSLRRLPATSTVVAPRGSGKYLSRWAGVEVHELTEGDTVQFYMDQGFTIENIGDDRGELVAVATYESRVAW